MTLCIKVTAALAGLGLAIAAGPAHAGPELVVNGGFEQTTATTSAQVTNTNLTGWSVAAPPGYTFLYLPDTSSTASASGTQADTVGASGQYGTVKLWGPGNGAANGLTNSPVGGNFIAQDNNFQSSAITQTIGGLIVGASYTLKFYWAAAQQYGFNGITQEQWTVKFGNQTAATETINLPEHGFSGWKAVTFYFTASSTSQVLSFMATGSPGGNPPFSLLDGVSLQVPEPGSTALLGVGLLGLAVFGLRRRRGSSGGASGGAAA